MSLAELLPFYTDKLAVPFAEARAVKVLVASRLSVRNARGKGNKAAKRAARIRSAMACDGSPLVLTPRDIDILAERYAHRRMTVPAMSFHD